MNLLQQLEDTSRGRDDGGLLHGGHVHFIQGKLSDEDQAPFLKAAIYGILEAVPDPFPEDLPERVESGAAKDLTDEQWSKFNEIAGGLIMPIEPFDVLRVIKAAREYLALVSQ